MAHPDQQRREEKEVEEEEEVQRNRQQQEQQQLDEGRSLPVASRASADGNNTSCNHGDELPKLELSAQAPEARPAVAREQQPGTRSSSSRQSSAQSMGLLKQQLLQQQATSASGSPGSGGGHAIPIISPAPSVGISKDLPQGFIIGSATNSINSRTLGRHATQEKAAGGSASQHSAGGS
eukprot:scaffold131575_cov17-Tisochrysis_lutea.AAC.1